MDRVSRGAFQRPEDNGAIPAVILAVGDGRVVCYERIAFQVSVSGLYNFSMTAANPEPSTLILLGAGLVAIALRRFNCDASGSAARRDLP